MPEDVELSPDGRSLALAGGWNTALEIRDAATLDERSTVDLGSGVRLWELSWSEDGGLLLAVGDGGLSQVIDAATWKAQPQRKFEAPLAVQIELVARRSHRPAAGGSSRCSTSNWVLRTNCRPESGSSRRGPSWCPTRPMSWSSSATRTGS